MARINEMRMPTWASLGLNYLKEDKINIENIGESSKAENLSEISEVEEAFAGHKVGISEKN